MRSLHACLLSVSIGLAPALVTSDACASNGSATYPERPIRLVVPYSAGGGADNVARIVANRLATTLGQQVIVDNKPGAGGVVGAETVARAKSDGYTVLFDASAFAVNPSLRKLSFDPQQDLLPVSLVVLAPNILVVPPSSPYGDFREFVAYAKQNPGKLTYASAGNGSASHLAGEMLNALASVDLLHVPYKGGAPALTDLMGNQVSSYFGNTGSTLGYIKSGKLRAIAVGSPKRAASLPDVPTLIESGLPGFVTQEWNGVFVPKGTPDNVVRRLEREIKAAVADPAVHGKLTELGLEPVGSDSAAFASFVEEEIERAAKLVKDRSVKAD